VGSELINLSSRLDDEHRAALEMLPPDLFDLSDISAARRRTAQLYAAFPPAPVPNGMTVTDVPVTSVDGVAIIVRLYVPADARSPAPAVLNIHGGGLVMLSVDADDRRCIAVAEKNKAVVVSVDYRLAPEHPFPIPLEDCWAALVWLDACADDLGVDRGRLAVMGSSAGGGLAAALTMMARDRSGPSLSYQHLVYPMLDDRSTTRSSGMVTDPRAWNHHANAIAWRAYTSVCAGDVPAWAAPARSTDLSGLPPCYLCVGDLDLFVDEDVAYAQALMAAGVSVELHVYPGAFHGSPGIVPGASLSRRWAADEMASLARHLA
jgi:acetyl esterase/lipase